MQNIDQAIISPNWIYNGIKNLHLHRLMRFDLKSGVGLNVLHGDIMRFLHNRVRCGPVSVEGCLKMRRNGESRLTQDYCGDPAAGTEKSFRVALEAATVRIPALATQAPYPQNLQIVALAPFIDDQAAAIADAIVHELQNYHNSKVEA